MLHSLGIKYVVLGHSERREYFQESNQLLAEKLNTALEYVLRRYFVAASH
jgi:triosephosphate isomerase